MCIEIPLFFTVPKPFKRGEREKEDNERNAEENKEETRRRTRPSGTRYRGVKR